jgi:archaeosortase A (PGF-CTERM-specific)
LETLIAHHLPAHFVLIERETATIIGAAGMVLLGVAWWWRERSVIRCAQAGWFLVGLYFFSQAWTYHSHDDPILTVMSALTLPLSCLAAWWEHTSTGQRKEASVWARGTVAFAGGPYLLISYVPYLSVLAIWFVASQSAWFLGFATGQNIEIGTTWVNDASGRVSWEEWEGNRWFATDFTGEYAFQSELLMADGTMIGINFVLACTAIQSMVLFIGAISVLNMSWKKRTRALLLVIPTIHALNVFRNAGLIWMHMTYTQWNLWGLSVFEFGHSYIARFVSLFAMFLLALIMFEMLPNMHRNIMALTGSDRRTRHR